MPKLIIDQFSSGLSNQLDRQLPSGKFHIGDGVDIYSSPGYIQPGIAHSNIAKTTNDMSLYWAFDENTGTAAYDSSGNGNTGTIVSAPPFVAGKLGYALDLDGSADYVSVATPTFINNTEGSISFWVKLDALNADAGLFSASVDGVTDDEFYLQYAADTTMQIVLNIDGVNSMVLGTAAGTIPNTTAYHHIVITSNGSTIKLYINNVEKTLTATTGANSGQWFASATQANIFTIGCRKRDVVGLPTNGKIDEVRIYNAALTAAEISELYTNPMISAILGSITDMCVDSLNEDIYFHDGTRISCMTSIENGTFNPIFDTTGGFNHTIATAEGQVGHSNLIIYPCNIASTPTNLLFYTWDETSGTDTGDVGTYPLTGTTFDDDWLSTIPANAVKLNYARHPLLEWKSILWIGNGNLLSKLDGTAAGGANGTFYPAQLTLPSGWEIIKLFPTSNYVGIIAWNKGILGTNTLCRAYFYDGSSTNFSFFIPIQENAVYDVINKNGEILFVGSGREEQGVLYRLTDNGTAKIMALKHYINGTEAKGGAGTYPNALAVHNNLLLIGNSQYGAVIYAYGQKEEGSPLSFSMPYRLSTGVTTNYQIKCIKPINATNIFVSWTDGTIYYLSRILLTSTTKTGANYKAGYIDFGQKVRVNYVKYYFKPLVSGDLITPTLEADYGTSWTLTDPNGNTTIGFTIDGVITSKRFNIKRDCHSIRPCVAWTTGSTAISKIVIDYQSQNIEDI